MTASSMVRLGGHKPLLTPPPTGCLQVGPLASSISSRSSSASPVPSSSTLRVQGLGLAALLFSGKPGKGLGEDGRCAKLAVGTRNDREISV